MTNVIIMIIIIVVAVVAVAEAVVVVVLVLVVVVPLLSNASSKPESAVNDNNFNALILSMML